MTPDELRPILTEYRKQVQQAWSKETAHPSFEGSDGSPVGQCGVTSAWLQRRLLEDHDIPTYFCIGAVRLNGRVVQSGNCWLELGDDETRLIIDLTVSQIPGISDLPVLYAHWWELRQDGIDYLFRYWRTTEQLVGDPVMDRLALLEGALS